MVNDDDSFLVIRSKKRTFMLFNNGFIIKPHFYNESWDGYRHLEFQILWFLFVYEYDRDKK